MKKIIIIFLILSSVVFSSTAFGDECDDIGKNAPTQGTPTCTVEGGPSAEVNKYIEDLNTAFSELKNKIASSSCGSDGLATTELTEISNITKDTNQVIDFGSFLSSWEFYVAPIFKGEVVYPLYRDHELIMKNQDKINDIAKQAVSNCALSVKIDGSKIKETLGSYGLTELDTVENILSGLRVLNNKITIFYRCAITNIDSCSSEVENSTNKSLTDLQKGIKTNYSSGCTTQGITLDKFKCKINKIAKDGIGFDKGIQEWIAAIKLMEGITNGNAEYQATEKKLLAEELAKQGLSTESSAVIMKNLECANNSKAEGCKNKCVDGGVTCFVKNIGNSVLTVINNLTGIYKKIEDEYIYQPGTTDALLEKLKALRSLSLINTDLVEDYRRIKSQMNQEDINLDKNIGNLLQIHQELTDLNKKFEPGIKVAEKMCKTCQAKGVGNCEF